MQELFLLSSNGFTRIEMSGIARLKSTLPVGFFLSIYSEVFFGDPLLSRISLVASGEVPVLLLVECSVDVRKEDRHAVANRHVIFWEKPR